VYHLETVYNNIWPSQGYQSQHNTGEIVSSKTSPWFDAGKYYIISLFLTWLYKSYKLFKSGSVSLLLFLL